jgi:hypothetical protein
MAVHSLHGFLLELEMNENLHTFSSFILFLLVRLANNNSWIGYHWYWGILAGFSAQIDGCSCPMLGLTQYWITADNQHCIIDGTES